MQLKNFDTETKMSISTFSGNDSGDGTYLKVLSQPVNVIQNSEALITIIQGSDRNVTTEKRASTSWKTSTSQKKIPSTSQKITSTYRQIFTKSNLK